MPIGLIGQKRGMTRIFTEAGESIPVSVIEVIQNQVVQLKSKDTDGYCAIQVGAVAKQVKISKPLSGHLAKAGVKATKTLMEFRVDEQELAKFKLGDSIEPSIFSVGQKLKVTAKSRGKGFAGVIKRHNFNSQRATHGNSLAHNAPGSIGQNQTPGRVFKGKKMAGHMGDEQVTVKNLEIVEIDADKSVILVKGAIPGAPGGKVVLTPANVKQMKTA